MKKNLGKVFSENQERDIAKIVSGRTQSNSGGTRFGGGDVHTKTTLIEAKTVTQSKSSITVKKEWLTKAKEQAFEQNKHHSAVAFRFEPDGEDYFIIDSKLFKILQDVLDKEE